MHTKDFLAQELKKAGLEEMAERATTGYYHDFLSPLDTPELQLMADLSEAAKNAVSANDAAEIMLLMLRHRQGEFDASLEESDEWAASPEGKAAYSILLSEFQTKRRT